MQVREAENPSTAHTGAAFQQVDAPAALVTVCRQFGVAEDAEFRHGPRNVSLRLDQRGVGRLEGNQIIPGRMRTFITP